MINVLLIGHSRKWRGGENQVGLLIHGMKTHHPDVNIHIAYPDDAIMIERLGVVVDGIIRLPSTRSFDLRSVLAIVKYCKHHRIDILHAQSGITHSLALHIKFFLPKIKIVVHRHVDFTIKKRLFTRRKYLSNKVDQYIAVSSAIEKRLLDYGIPDEKIALAKSSIDPLPYMNLNKQTAKSNICERYDIDKNLVLIGFAGALDANKDPITFVRIISQLRQGGIKVNALIAGVGDLMSAVEQQVEALNLKNNVKLTGFVQDMPVFFAALDIFILPSTAEGLGTVLLEAIHANANVIASDVGGIREIVRDGETGLLAKAKDINSFTHAVEKLLSCHCTAKRLRNNAINHVGQEFNLQKMLDNNYKIYRQLHKEDAE